MINININSLSSQIPTKNTREREHRVIVDLLIILMLIPLIKLVKLIQLPICTRFLPVRECVFQHSILK